MTRSAIRPRREDLREPVSLRAVTLTVGISHTTFVIYVPTCHTTSKVYEQFQW
jgi:hypothetical protein